MSRLVFHSLLYVALAFFTFLLIRISLPYLSFESDEAFLAIKQQYIDYDVWYFSFYIHVFTSFILLLAGFTQFTPYFLHRRKHIHRNLGYLYVTVLLLLAGPSGLVLSLYANGGSVSRLAFILLTTIWLFSTIMALRTALQKRFFAHKNWMIISYALTLSAVTLRAWRFLLANYWDDLGFELIRPMDLYRIVAWLGWVPNFLFALYLVSRKNN